jgi:Rieske 2Fe-2S family protein
MADRKEHWMTTTALRSPADEYTGPPKERFLDEAWHERDLEAVFRSKWLVAGHVDELDVGPPGHGYITFSLGREEVLIRRDEEGQVRGYHNVCPHRGAQLCESGSGSVASKRIVCPYHAWTFSVSDGRLLSARHMHEDFDPAALPLMAVHVEVWKGLIFVCLADEYPGSVADHMREASFGGYDIDSMSLATAKSHEIEANWKIVVENNFECYHCVVIHPELSREMDWLLSANIDFEGHRAARANGLEVLQGQPIPSALTIGSERVCEIPAPRPDGNPDPPSWGFVWEPGAAVAMSRDMGWLFVPKPLGPHRTELRQYWLVAEDAQEGRDYDLDNLKRFWDTTMLQDRDICEAVQRGMSMPAYTPGPLNRIHQTGQAGFYAWYTEQIRRFFPDLVHDPIPAQD